MDSPGTNPALSGQEAAPPIPNRRRRVRHKVHTPAYASLDESTSGMVLDLSEVLDISEDGMAIQTSSPLAENQVLNLCLDLSETKSYINTSGHVIWWHGSGRAGIRFPKMADESARALKQWLFANAIAGCVNHEAAVSMPATESPQSSTDAADQPAEPQSVSAEPFPLEPPTPDLPDYTTLLAALAAVRREVDALGPDLEAALQLSAERAQAFTHATGAAIALSQNDVMICRATSGPQAPGHGARLQIGSGFSGECVRSGKLLRCEDSESDPRVDRESCRILGIRSMIGVPVRQDAGIIGLLEVFSPNAYAFGDDHNTALERLAETIAAAVRRKSAPAAVKITSPAPVQVSSTESALVRSRFPINTIALILAVLVLGMTVLVSIAPWLRIRAGSPMPAANAPVQQAVTRTAPTSVPAANDFEGLRMLADQGDPAAQFAMGAHYATGEDVKQSYTEAVRWFARAAERGHVVAQATLGAYYWAGRGVPQDLNKAYYWSILAQAGGDEASKYRVAVLTSRMSRAQVVAAQQQANDWIKQHQLALTAR